MKKILLLGLVGFSTLTSYSQKKIEYIEYDLPNGIHVILHEEHATPIVAVSILYHVGSKNEKSDRTGFAHFFEHLLFEGSTNIKRGEYSQLVEKNGGALNANTSNDRTYYYEVLPSNQLELGIWLESERLLHAKVENTGIETQRSVVKEEKRQRIDNQPYASFIGEIFKRMFTVHPYNWQPIGSMEHLDAAQEKDYVDFYRTFYVPANSTLSIAGDLNIEQTKKWVEKYFASIPKGQAINLFRDYETMADGQFIQTYGLEKSKFDSQNFLNSKDPSAKKVIATYSEKPTIIPRPEKPTESSKGIVKAVIYDNIQLPALFMAYRLPEQTNADFPALEMLNEILSGSSSSRINKDIVEKKQLAMQAFTFAYGLEDAGVGIFAGIGSNDTNLDTLQIEFDKHIERIKKELITQDEYEKIRNQFENQLVSSNSSIAGICENLADNYVYYGDANRVNNQLESYLKVTREDIQRVAQKYLTQEERIILHYLPQTDKN
jgi:zinc protease